MTKQLEYLIPQLNVRCEVMIKEATGYLKSIEKLRTILTEEDIDIINAIVKKHLQL